MRDELGNFLRELREENNLKLYEMAKQLNITSSFLSAIEHNKKDIPYKLVNKIIETYNLPYDKIGKLIKCMVDRQLNKIGIITKIRID